MKIDPTIRRIRDVRHRISEQCDHDPEKLVAYYIRRQKEHPEKLVRKSREESVKQET